MQMINRLPTLLARVHDRAKATIQFFHGSNAADLQEKASKLFCIVSVRYIGNMILGKNQYMCGRLGINISDGNVTIIFTYYS